ncbi:D-galactonate dehydratase family member SeV_A0456, partial [Geodia barretti]
STVTIRDIKVILTEPDGIRLVIVKVETSEPGPLRGRMRHLHAATLPVKVAVENYLRPFLIGRNVSDIEDIWQSSYVSSYWRNGGVLNNALSGVDQALWDIKGKMAGMPVYDLLGGRAREAAAVYVHASGREPAEVADKVSAFMDQGFHHIRVQVDTPGYATYGTKGLEKKAETGAAAGGGPRQRSFVDHADLELAAAKVGAVREAVGPRVEILVEVHRRLSPIEAIMVGRMIEKYRPYWFEEPCPPENIRGIAEVKNALNIPVTIGEAIYGRRGFVEVFERRAADYLNPDISNTGGILEIVQIAAMAEAYDMGISPHGANPLSPVSTAACLQIAASVPNFSLQEYPTGEDVPPKSDMVTGTPVHDGNGYLIISDEPGIGVELKPDAREKVPFTPREINTRLHADGSVIDQ